MDRLQRLPYTKITSEKQYNSYCKKLSRLVFEEVDSDDTGVSEHIELLSLLIKDWNDRQFDGDILDPISLLKSLMDDHGLIQKDIARICDVNKSFVSEVFNYKKYISKKMIRKLADYFKIRQDALNRSYKLEKQVVYILEAQQMFLEPSESNWKWYGHSEHEEIHKQVNRDLLTQPDDGIFNLKIKGEC